MNILRKATPILIVSMLILSLFLFSSCGNDSKEIPLEYELNDDDTYTVVGIGNVNGNEIIIPSTYKGKKVTNIAHFAFANNNNIISVKIGDNITNIGSHAFENCDRLVDITIPDSVTNIGTNTFAGCYNIDNITTPVFALSYIPNEKLKTVTITNGNKITNEFNNCTELKSLIIKNVEKIGNNAFSNCANLENVTIENVKIIGDSAFYLCENLKSVYITDIPSWCNITFGDCYSNPLSYARNLYLNNTLVENLIIPNGVTSISKYAFYNCSITCVEIPSSLTDIGDRAFECCYKLVEVRSRSKLNIARDTNNGYVGYYALNILPYNSDAWMKGEIFVTDDEYVFYEYGKKCYLIGYEGDSKKLVLPKNYNGKSYKIAKYAFYNKSDIISVNIPNGVTEIGDFAFYGCSNIESIEIPESVTYIYEGAFYNCRNLTNLDIKAKISVINEYTFYNCSNLKNIKLPNSVNHIFENAFYGCDNIETATIPANAIFYINKEKLKTITITNGKIDRNAFKNCSSLTNVTIGEDVTSIGSCAFMDCSSLENVIIGNKVREISDYAFLNCNKLNSVKFANTTGWSVSTYKDTELSSDSLKSPLNAAKLLKDTYCNYYWTRS